MYAYLMPNATTISHAPMKRNDGPASWFIDSTVPSLVYRPVAYSSMISGMDHSHRKQHQTIRNTNAPKAKTQSRLYTIPYHTHTLLWKLILYNISWDLHLGVSNSNSDAAMFHYTFIFKIHMYIHLRKTWRCLHAIHHNSVAFLVYLWTNCWMDSWQNCLPL